MATDIDDNLADFGDLVSIEAFSAITDAVNNCIDSVKVGEVATIFVLDGVTPPLDATIWQECNGSLITEPLSPLQGQLTPDHRNRYMIGATSLSTVGQVGGSNTRNLQHSHGGITEISGFDNEAVDSSSAQWEAVDHAHGINTDLTATENFEPLHFKIKHYLKIR